MKYIYFGEIERFGHTLHCIGKSEEEVKDALIKTYVETYKRDNGTDPKEEYMKMKEGRDEYNEVDARYYEVFLDEIYIEKRQLGTVHWD